MGGSGFGKGNPNVPRDPFAETTKTFSDKVDALKPWKAVEYAKTPAGCPAKPGSEDIWDPVFGSSPFRYEMVPHGCQLSDAAVIMLKLQSNDDEFDPKSLSEFKGFNKNGCIITSKGTIKRRKQTRCGSTLRDLDGDLMTVEGIVMRGDGRNDQFRDPGNITEDNFGKQDLRRLILWHNRYIHGVDTNDLHLAQEYSKRWLERHAPESADGSGIYRRTDCQMRHDLELEIETTVDTNYDDDLEEDLSPEETTAKPSPKGSATKKTTPEPKSLRTTEPRSLLGTQIDVDSNDEEPDIFSSDDLDEVPKTKSLKSLPQSSLKSLPKSSSKAAWKTESSKSLPQSTLKSLPKSSPNPTLEPSPNATQVPPRRTKESTAEKKAQSSRPLKRSNQIKDGGSDGNAKLPRQLPRGWSRRFLCADGMLLRKSAVTTRFQYIEGDNETVVRMSSYFPRRDRREVRDKLTQVYKKTMIAFDEMDEDDSESDVVDDRPQKKRKT